MKNTKSVLGIFVAVLFTLSFVSCASAPAKESSDAPSAGPITVEFESGIVEGNIVKNAGPDKESDGELGEASGDFFYMQDSGTLTVVFDAPEAGDYIVKIYYAIPTTYGDKANNVIINGEDLGELPFPITQGKWAAKWIQTSLKEGTNTITVAHNWGYTWFDYLTAEQF